MHGFPGSPAKPSAAVGAPGTPAVKGIFNRRNSERIMSAVLCSSLESSGIVWRRCRRLIVCGRAAARALWMFDITTRSILTPGIPPAFEVERGVDLEEPDLVARHPRQGGIV